MFKRLLIVAMGVLLLLLTTLVTVLLVAPPPNDMAVATMKTSDMISDSLAVQARNSAMKLAVGQDAMWMTGPGDSVSKIPTMASAFVAVNGLSQARDVSLAQEVPKLKLPLANFVSVESFGSTAFQFV